MTTYTKVWALKSDTPANPGDKVTVTLKSGQSKEVVIAASFPSNGHFILIPEGVEDLMTIAERFLKEFGPHAFSVGHARGLAAVAWLAHNDPDGTGQAIPDGIAYHFSDRSSLIFDLATHTFRRPQ